MTLSEYKQLEFPQIEKYLELIEELNRKTEQKTKGNKTELADT